MKSLFLAAMVMAIGLASGASAQSAKKPSPKTAPAVRDWTTIVTTTPAGNVILGNPQARVKVIEYLSFTCSHCAEFSVDSAAVLKGQLIKSGSTSIEYRPIARDLLDIGATLLVRCAGGRGFVGGAEEIFARQGEWLSIGMGFMERDAKRFALDTPLGQVRAAAQASGLIDLMQARGLSPARINACFADQTILAKMLANGDAARKVIKGTPSIVINGVPTDAFTWAKVEPLLRARGAR
jgi:protein-disulfide isomerase